MNKQTHPTISVDVPQEYLDFLKKYDWARIDDEKKTDLAAKLAVYLNTVQKIPYKPTGWIPNPKITYKPLSASRAVLDHCPHLIDTANCFDWQYFNPNKIKSLLLQAKVYLATARIPTK